MTAPPDSDLPPLLDDLAAHIRATLGPALIGLYVSGSLVAGGFDLECSDIDLLAVTAAGVSDGQYRALQEMHTRFIAEHPAWDDRLDIIYISAADLREFRTRPAMMALITPGEPFHRNAVTPHWFINWYLVLRYGRSLYGPPVEAVLSPVSREEFVRAVRSHARGWTTWITRMQSRKQQAYAILTLCRALYASRHGEQVSKLQAAWWAQGELPRWAPLIDQALQWRQAWRDEAVDHQATYPDTLAFVQFAIARIADDDTPARTGDEIALVDPGLL